MTLEEIKKFLKVDFKDDDDYIELLKDVAIEYIIDSIGSFNPGRAKQRLLALTLINNMYEKRSYIADSKDEKVQFILRSIVMQEQLAGDENA